MTSLLTDRLIGTRDRAGAKVMRSLPGVLHALAQNDISAFTALQPHQVHAWHAFLVHVAAIALHHGAQEIDNQNAQVWGRMLRAIGGGTDDPWSLNVSDLTKPAFMQPPIPAATLADYKNRSPTPDALDVLITAKNHDIKGARISRPDPEHWIYALVSLQTMQGFLGAGNFGIAKMNKGHASRPGVGLSPCDDPSSHFRRDVAVLMAGRSGLCRSYPYQADGGVTLMWLLPWSGADSLALSECDPLFIEICRRVRLIEVDNRLVACMATSKVSRIQATESLGNTGDAWTPVHSEGKALTVGRSGFSYELTQELLFSANYRPSIAQQHHARDGEDPVLIARVLVRGQGTTDGLHERILPLPGRIAKRLGQAQERARLGEIAKRRVEIASRVKRSLLKPALCALLQAGAERLRFDDDRAVRWLESLDDAIDDRFFPHLFSQLERDDDPNSAVVEADWVRVVVDQAALQLEAAISTVPFAEVRRYKAIASAMRIFHGAKYRLFPEAYPREGVADA